MAHVRDVRRVGGAAAMTAVFAGPAGLAEIWEGLRADEMAHCRREPISQEDGTHSHTGRPFFSHDSACHVRSVSPVKPMKTWMVDLVCDGRAGSIGVREFLMVPEEDKLARFTEDGYLFQMVRCK